MDINKFKALLDEQYTWPDYYTFKFVIKSEDKHQIYNILGKYELSETPSKKGTYVSITARALINQSDEIIFIYQKVAKLEGVISL